jgi:hypothetical protein
LVFVVAHCWLIESQPLFAALHAALAKRASCRAEKRPVMLYLKNVDDYGLVVVFGDAGELGHE